MHPALWLLLAIVAEVVGTTALKVSDGFRHLVPVLVVVAGYGVASGRCRCRCAPSRSAWSTPCGAGSGRSPSSSSGWWRSVSRSTPIKFGGIALIMVGVVMLNVVSGGHA